MAATMATPELEGNRLSGLFQRLLQGLCEGRRAVGTAFPPVVPANAGTTRREATQSALQQRRDALGKLLERGLALEHLAIDEEGRCRIDLQNFVGVSLV